MAFLIRRAGVRTGSGNKRTRMNAVGSLWEQTQLWQTNYMADVPRPSIFFKIPRNFGDELGEEEVQEECGVADNSPAMIDSASSTCEKQDTPNLFERLLRNKVGPRRHTRRGRWLAHQLQGAYSYTLGEAEASQGARMMLSLPYHRASCSVELTWALRFDEKKKALHPCGIGLVARQETTFKIESVALAGALLSE